MYSKTDIPKDYRERIIKIVSDKYSIGNCFFEESDEFYSRTTPSMYFDVMYRKLDWVYHEMEIVWRRHQARLGYTTCFLNNIRNSKILFDRTDEFQRILEELQEPYPEELARNIVIKNYPMLRYGCAMPYFEQVKLAIKRQDIVSQNHRIAALLASYFDILFAVNRQTHPGEKNLVQYALKLCKKLPRDFQSDINGVVQLIGKEGLICALEKLLNELDELLKSENYI